MVKFVITSYSIHYTKLYDFFITQATLYLATTKKSNTTMAYFDALKAVEEEKTEIPNHLKA